MGRGVGRGPRPSYDDDGRGEDGTGKKGEGGRPHGVANWRCCSRGFPRALHALKRFPGASNCCWKPL